MAKISFKKIFIGLFLITLAFVLLVCAFYFLKVKPTLAERRKSRLAMQKARSEKDNIPSYNYKEVIISNEEGNIEEQKNPSDKAAKTGPISSDKARLSTEGFLWIDRKAEKYVITLGTANGVSSGTRFDVYDGDNKIGEVVVASPFDVISYVNPSAEFSNKLSKDYYRVVIK